MPGEQYSLNGALGGPRKKRDGWVLAPSIADGAHTMSAGGGISQVATTTYNALFYAGVQVDQHKAHSQYFTRYPKGREATLGYPYPDLKFTNDTPGPLVIWTSYTDTSVTVSMWGTPDGRGHRVGTQDGPPGELHDRRHRPHDHLARRASEGRARRHRVPARRSVRRRQARRRRRQERQVRQQHRLSRRRGADQRRGC